MSITHVEAVVSGSSGRQAKLRLLVDSGATYSVLPEAVWRELGLEARRTVDFSLVDGTLITRQVSECEFAVDGEAAHSPVVLGEGADQAILGVVLSRPWGSSSTPSTARSDR